MKVELQGLDEVLGALKQIGVDAVEAVEAIATAAAEPAARAVAAKAPGKIGEDIVTATTEKSKQRVTVSVGPSRKQWFARFLEYGTTPHTVTARRQRALKLYGLGDVFRRKVDHSGTAAQPFMRPAFDTTQQAAQQRAMAAAKKAVGAA